MSDMERGDLFATLAIVFGVVSLICTITFTVITCTTGKECPTCQGSGRVEK